MIQAGKRQFTKYTNNLNMIRNFKIKRKSFENQNACCKKLNAE